MSMFFIAFMFCLSCCKVSARGGCILGIYSGLGILQHMLFAMSPWFVVFSRVAFAFVSSVCIFYSQRFFILGYCTDYVVCSV